MTVGCREQMTTWQVGDPRESCPITFCSEGSWLLPENNHCVTRNEHTKPRGAWTRPFLSPLFGFGKNGLNIRKLLIFLLRPASCAYQSWSQVFIHTPHPPRSYCVLGLKPRQSLSFSPGTHKVRNSQPQEFPYTVGSAWWTSRGTWWSGRKSRVFL